MSIIDSVERFIVDEVLMNRTVTLDRQQSLTASGILDSLALLRLISFLEDHFNVAIEDHELLPENFSTIEQIAGLVKDKLAAA